MMKPYRRTGRRRSYLWVLVLAVLVVLLLPRAMRMLYPLPYREIIVNLAHREGLDPLLVAAVIRVESKFYPLAQSDQGALGLMQLMPDTARLAAGNLGLPYDDKSLFNPEYNLRLGTWYLAHLVQEFGDLIPALAAYNGGRGNVHYWLERGIWDGDIRNLHRIPFPETREFVRQVIRTYRTYRALYPGVR